MKFLIIFQNTHRALKAEKILKNNYKVRTIPTPRQISSECGFSLLLETSSKSFQKKISSYKKLKYDKLYKIIEMGGIEYYEESS